LGIELVAAWNTHNVDALVAMFAPDCRYTDVPHGLSWEGHDGIRHMFDLTVDFHPDYQFVLDGGFSDERHYAVEWTISGTTLGQPLRYRGVPVGALDQQGRIVENRDYWNPKDIPGL
jgi:hypothetical protein